MGGEFDQDPCTAPAARKVLRALEACWPASCDLGPAVLEELAAGAAHFVALMHALCDHGCVMVEAVVVQDGVPSFRDVAITPRGRATLAALKDAG